METSKVSKKNHQKRKKIWNFPDEPITAFTKLLVEFGR